MACLLIAEIGVNHNGSLDLAKEMLLSAKNCGADIVKFQTFSANNLVTTRAKKAAYQIADSNTTESQYDMLKRLELSTSDFTALKEYCDRVMIEFCSTPFSVQDAKFLNSLDIRTFKVGSGNLTDRPLHEFLSKTGKKVIISTGMSTEKEISDTLDIYRQESTLDSVTLMLCTSAYPTNPTDIHLNSMAYLRDTFGLPVGFSDHTKGNYAGFAAAALGACIIEKHFTTNKTLEGPDQKSSASPEEFGDLVKGVRVIEMALGSAIKPLIESEQELIVTSRKSIVASRDIPIGYTLEYSDISFKRPGDGLSPMLYPYILGRKTAVAIRANQQIKFEDLENAD